MIKKLKRVCYVAVCDVCKNDLFGREFVQHFGSKAELLEMIEHEMIDTVISDYGKKHYCSTECWHKAVGIKDE